ncbi:MAG: hypothetical protein ACRC52_10995, partial [Aeromonas veronii]
MTYFEVSGIDALLVTGCPGLFLGISCVQSCTHKRPMFQVSPATILIIFGFMMRDQDSGRVGEER